MDNNQRCILSHHFHLQCVEWMHKIYAAGRVNWFSCILFDYLVSFFPVYVSIFLLHILCKCCLNPIDNYVFRFKNVISRSRHERNGRKTCVTEKRRWQHVNGNVRQIDATCYFLSNESGHFSIISKFFHNILCLSVCYAGVSHSRRILGSIWWKCCMECWTCMDKRIFLNIIQDL